MFFKFLTERSFPSPRDIQLGLHQLFQGLSSCLPNYKVSLLDRSTPGRNTALRGDRDVSGGGKAHCAAPVGDGIGKRRENAPTTFSTT